MMIPLPECRGGVRELIIPASLAFGTEGKLVLASTALGAAGSSSSGNVQTPILIPPWATLTYIVSLEDVSPSYL